MPEIHLPQKIIFGSKSSEKLANGGFGSVLLISDGGLPEFTNKIKSLEQKLLQKIPQVKTFIEPNSEKLYELSLTYVSAFEVDRIIAVGSAELIDSAMLLSYQSDIGFSAVPRFSSCAMTDFENASYKTYRKTPCETILDSDLVMYSDSGTIAYDAFSCFAYAADALISCNNSVIFSLAAISAADILNNIVGAYRGNCKAIQKLQYSMYCSVLAHRNMLSLSNSVLEDVTSFFSQLDLSKRVVAAVCIPELLNYYRTDVFLEIARSAGLCRAGESSADSIERLIERVRAIQAAINIPRCVGAIRPDRELFQTFCENTHLPNELLDLCYNGSFKFMKL